MSGELLSVDGLSVEIDRAGSKIVPVDGVSLTISDGEILGLVGESGSGKSLTLRAIMGLLPPGGKSHGAIRLRSNGVMQTLDQSTTRRRKLAMVFQEPMTALDPLMRVRDLIAEPMIVNRGVRKGDARERAVDLMRSVGIPDPDRRALAYPHQLSGGLRQRVMIAMTLAAEPSVLLCDEPTTALDVTIQDQILGLLLELRDERNLAMLFVTHDLAVVSELCDRVAVMYAGRIVETGITSEVFSRPRHPYTEGLLASVPRFEAGAGDLASIGGSPPDPTAFPSGCRFRTRCPYAQEDCATAPHQLTGIKHRSACIHPESIGAVTWT